MNTFLKYASIGLMSATFGLTACSSGSGSGPGGGATGGTVTAEDPVALSESNSQDFAVAATEGALETIESRDAPQTPFGIEVANPDLIALEIVNNNAAQSAALPVGIVQDFSSQLCTGGGTASGDINLSGSGGTFTFNNCVYASGITLSGSFEYTSTTSGDTTEITITYNNFTITYPNSEAFTIASMTMTCTTTGQSTSCTRSSSFTGRSGGSYTITSSTVTGNSSSGFNVNATVSISSVGSVTIETTSPIVLGCDNGWPSSGTITYTGSGGLSASVTFNSCTSYTVTFNGVSNTFSWPEA